MALSDRYSFRQPFAPDSVYQERFCLLGEIQVLQNVKINNGGKRIWTGGGLSSSSSVACLYYLLRDFLLLSLFC